MKRCADCTRLRIPAAEQYPADPNHSYCLLHKRILGRFRYQTKVRGEDPHEAAIALGLTEAQAQIYVAAHCNTGRGRPRKDGADKKICVCCNKNPQSPNSALCPQCLETFREEVA